MFDQNLVRRFALVVGIYPVGNLVRLNCGVVAVVRKAYPPDPYRPRVRVLICVDGATLERRTTSTWEAVEYRLDRRA
jgi:hypothetical protein